MSRAPLESVSSDSDRSDSEDSSFGDDWDDDEGASCLCAFCASALRNKEIAAEHMTSQHAFDIKALTLKYKVIDCFKKQDKIHSFIHSWPTLHHYKQLDMYGFIRLINFTRSRVQSMKLSELNSKEVKFESILTEKEKTSKKPAFLDDDTFEFDKHPRQHNTTITYRRNNLHRILCFVFQVFFSKVLDSCHSW